MLSTASSCGSAIASVPIASVDSVNVLASTGNYTLTHSQFESVKRVYLLDAGRGRV